MASKGRRTQRDVNTTLYQKKANLFAIESTSVEQRVRKHPLQASHFMLVSRSESKKAQHCVLGITGKDEILRRKDGEESWRLLSSCDV